MNFWTDHIQGILGGEQTKNSAASFWPGKWPGLTVVQFVFSVQWAGRGRVRMGQLCSPVGNHLTGRLQWFGFWGLQSKLYFVSSRLKVFQFTCVYTFAIWVRQFCVGWKKLLIFIGILVNILSCLTDFQVYSFLVKHTTCKAESVFTHIEPEKFRFSGWHFASLKRDPLYCWGVWTLSVHVKISWVCA